MRVAIWHYTNRNFRIEVRMQRAVRYHTSPVLLFSISSCISPFFFLIRMWLHIHTVSFHSQQIFTRHVCINTTRLSWFLCYILMRLCRATFLSIVHEYQWIYTYLKFEFQPTTSLRIYNFAYAHYMFDEFIVTNIHDTQDHTRMYMYVYMYAQSIYVSFRLIPHFI